jgi:hypothetical protein
MTVFGEIPFQSKYRYTILLVVKFYYSVFTRIGGLGEHQSHVPRLSTAHAVVQM